MRQRRRIVFMLMLLAVLDIIIPSRAYAYLDPGTGSLFLQVFLAVLLAGLFAIKVFWKRITGFIKNLFVKK